MSTKRQNKNATNKARRDRYKNDPAFREAVKEASRRSHEKARRARGILPRGRTSQARTTRGTTTVRNSGAELFLSGRMNLPENVLDKISKAVEQKIRWAIKMENGVPVDVIEETSGGVQS